MSDQESIECQSLSKIVVKFRKRRFLSQLYRCNKIIAELNNHISVSLKKPEDVHLFSSINEFDDKQFETHQNVLTSKDTLNEITKLIKLYYLYVSVDTILCPKLSSRSFLTAWTIVSFPQFVLNISREVVSKDVSYRGVVYRMAFNLINRLKALMNDATVEHLRLFNKAIILFSNSFTYFMNADKIEKINELSLHWYEIGKNIKLIETSDANYEDKQMSLSKIHHVRKNIERYITTILPGFDLKLLERYETITDAFERNMKRSYSDLLLEDIKNQTYNVTRQVMEEIKRSLCLLNPELSDMLNEYLDVEFILQKHKNSVMEFEDVLNFGDFMVDIINKLQAPIAINTTNSTWNLIKIKECESVDNLLNDLLIFILDEIEKIRENILNIQAIISVGINPLFLTG